MDDKEEIKHLIRQLNDTSYYNRKIIHINNELECIRNELVGVSSPTFKGYVIENHKPFTHSKYLELITKEEELILKREYFANEILKHENLIQSLSDDIRKHVIELYILQYRHNEVARHYNYTRQGLYNKINREILKVLHCN